MAVVVSLSRGKGSTPLGFLFALRMKYARSAATTSTGTTIEVTKTDTFFLDALVVLLHILVLESYLKYMTTRSEFYSRGVNCP